MAVGMEQLADSLLRAGLLTDTEFESACNDLSAAEAVSFELDANFQRMLAKSPEDRFQSLAEVVAALDQFERGHEPAASATDDLTEATVMLVAAG